VDAADAGDVVVVAAAAVVEEIVAIKVDETCLLRNTPRHRVTEIHAGTTIAGRHPEIARRDLQHPWILEKMTLFCQASPSRNIARGLSKLPNQSESGSPKNGSQIMNRP